MQIPFCTNRAGTKQPFVQFETGLRKKENPPQAPWGGTQFFVHCQPCILMLKLTPKQVFSKSKKGDPFHVFKPILCSEHHFQGFFFSKGDPFHVLLDLAHIALADLDCKNRKDQNFGRNVTSYVYAHVYVTIQIQANWVNFSEIRGVSLWFLTLFMCAINFQTLSTLCKSIKNLPFLVYFM